ISKEKQWQPFATDVDWRMVPAGILVLFAVWILAGVALLFFTRLGMISSLALCSAGFLFGLVSAYIYAPASAVPGQVAWWASILGAILPNWQLLWLADALEEGKRIPWSYVATSFAYVLAYVGAALAAALYLFEERELA